MYSVMQDPSHSQRIALSSGQMTFGSSRKWESDFFYELQGCNSQTGHILDPCNFEVSRMADDLVDKGLKGDINGL